MISKNLARRLFVILCVGSVVSCGGDKAPSKTTAKSGELTAPAAPGTKTNPPSRQEENKSNWYNNDFTDPAALSSFALPQLHMRIVDLTRFKSVVRDRSALILGGEVVSKNNLKELKKLFDKGAALCSIRPLVATPDDQLKENILLGILKAEDHPLPNGEGHLRMDIEGKKLYLECTKLDPKPFALKEVRDAFRGIVEILISK